jgi:hypothetical protein
MKKLAMIIWIAILLWCITVAISMLINNTIEVTESNWLMLKFGLAYDLIISTIFVLNFKKK